MPWRLNELRIGVLEKKKPNSKKHPEITVLFQYLRMLVTSKVMNTLSLDYENQMISSARATGQGQNLFFEVIKFFVVYSLIEGFLSFLLDVVLENKLSTPTSQSIAFLAIDVLGILLVILFCRYIERRPLVSMGLVKTKIGKQYLCGIMLGVIVFSIVYILGCLFKGYRLNGINHEINPLLLFTFLVVYMVQGMYEELMCRGFLMVSISRKYPTLVGILISSLIFVLMHATNEGFTFIPAINLFLFAFFAAVLCLYTDSIWVVSAFHTIWNFIEGNIFGLTVSGMRMSESMLVTELSDNTLITGGLFGPEGGVPVTITVMLCIIAIVCIRKQPE